MEQEPAVGQSPHQQPGVGDTAEVSGESQASSRERGGESSEAAPEEDEEDSAGPSLRESLLVLKDHIPQTILVRSRYLFYC